MWLPPRPLTAAERERHHRLQRCGGEREREPPLLATAPSAHRGCPRRWRWSPHAARRLARNPTSAVMIGPARVGRQLLMLSESSDDDGDSSADDAVLSRAVGPAPPWAVPPPRVAPAGMIVSAAHVLERLRDEAAHFPPAHRHLSKHCKHARGDSPPVAVTLGAIRNYASADCCLSDATRRFRGLTAMLTAFARGAIEAGSGGAVAHFTTVQVNRNCRMKMHKDANNAGPSLAIALGDFRGGALYVARRGDLDLRERWVAYDGNASHCTRAFTGER